MNAGSSILESYLGERYCADTEGNLRKVDMLADNEDPLREEAIEEAGLWEGVCEKIYSL